jgi:hypothetical protein
MSYNVSSASVLVNDMLTAAVKMSIATGVDAATAIAVADDTFFRDISSVARAHTLADGTVDGATVLCVKTADTGVGTITPATFKDGTSIPLTNIGDMVSFVWKDDGTEQNWRLSSAINLLTSASIAVTA